MNVRNFWIETRVDGNKPVASGPRAKDGGFSLTIKMRDEGGITTPVRIDGFARPDGTLRLVIDVDDDNAGVARVLTKETTR
jgi:hypothetical protein